MDPNRLPYDGFEVAIPPTVAVCPYCGSRLSASANAWEESETSAIWDVIEIELTCEQEENEEGSVDHSDLPYVYWLLLETKIVAWLNQPQTKAAYGTAAVAGLDAIRRDSHGKL